VIKAVLYLRSSKDRHDSSIDAQRRALEELAEQRGFHIVGEYSDAVWSGKDENRPAFQALLRDLRDANRSWSNVLVFDTSRIARNRYLSMVFEGQDCKRRGVKVVYKSLPESDPVTETLLKAILQSIDEYHSMVSKAKGLAGMAENVHRGYRAGGIAPTGYKLQYIETGAIRDGNPVRKSKLIPGDDAPKVRTYLKHRANGLKRSRALALAGAKWSPSTLLSIERNVEMYAGHTVWNRISERDDAGYIGGKKFRPRDEWVVKRDTHEALITDEEAAVIQAALDKRSTGGGRPAHRVYTLAGLMTSPDGLKWQGDNGDYRLGKGARVNSTNVESAILSRVVADLSSDEMASSIAAHYREIGKKSEARLDEKDVRRKIASIDTKIKRLAESLATSSTPEAFVRLIEGEEKQREEMRAKLETMESEKSVTTALKQVTVSDVRQMMKNLLSQLEEANPESVKDFIGQAVEHIKLTPDTYDAVITYRIAPASKGGVCMASPRGFEPRFTP
jgi:site-specific DNA recombinase